MHNQRNSQVKMRQLFFYSSLSREIVMYVQKDLKTALWAAPMEYEALRKEYGQYTLIPEQYAGVLKNDQRKKKRRRKK